MTVERGEKDQRMDGQVAIRSPDKTLILQPSLWYSLGAFFICRSEVRCTQSEAPVKSPPSLQDLPRGVISLFKAYGKIVQSTISSHFHCWRLSNTVGKDSTSTELYPQCCFFQEETVSSGLGWSQTMQLTLHFWFSCLHLLESQAWPWARFLCCWGLNPGLCDAW